MKTKKGPKKTAPEYSTRNGRTVVVLDQDEYERLRDKADEWEPLMPEPNGDGCYPAVQAGRVSLARSILRDRRRLGLSQVELARRAKIRPETLNRIERAKNTASVATIDKIVDALEAAGAPRDD